MYMIKCDRCGTITEVESLMTLYPIGDKKLPRYNILYMDGDKSKQIALCEKCELALTVFINEYHKGE